MGMEFGTDLFHFLSGFIKDCNSSRPFAAWT
jgi:hypothetical protein